MEETKAPALDDTSPAPISQIPISKKRTYKKPEKVYTVRIIYVPISDEEAKIKLSTIEGIIKKSHFK